jgi:hypothetical protein
MMGLHRPVGFRERANPSVQTVRCLRIPDKVMGWCDRSVKAQFGGTVRKTPHQDGTVAISES